MKKVLFTTMSKYPQGDAGATRQHTLAKMFQANGYIVSIISMGESTNFFSKTYDGVEYTSFRSNRSSIVSRLLNLILYKKRLRKFINENSNFDTILIVSVPIHALMFLKKYARFNSIKLIHDSVEWYSKEQFFMGRFSPTYIIKDLYNRRFIDNDFSVIAISDFLKDHFESRGINTIKIPVVMDVKNMNYRKKISSDKFILLYAGSIGKKDYFEEIIKGLGLLNNSYLNKIEFRVIGISESQFFKKVINNIIIKPEVFRTLKFYGRVSRKTVLDNLAKANFTVLIRSPLLRYAKAGFPTKVVESLASGTPVISNLTSDLENYLVDKKNSVIVDDCTSIGFYRAIIQVLQYSPCEMEEMFKYSRSSAIESFHYERYLDILNKII